MHVPRRRKNSWLETNPTKFYIFHYSSVQGKTGVWHWLLMRTPTYCRPAPSKWDSTLKKYFQSSGRNVIFQDDFEGFMSIVNSRSKFPSLFEKVRFWWICWTILVLYRIHYESVDVSLSLLQHLNHRHHCCLFVSVSSLLKTYRGLFWGLATKTWWLWGQSQRWLTMQLNVSCPWSSTEMAMAHWPSNESCCWFQCQCQGQGQ